jgi:hypothetical protein
MKYDTIRVGTAQSIYRLRYGLARPGFDLRQRQKALLRKSRPFLGPSQSRIQSVPTALTQRVKRPELEADQSVSSSVDIKIEWRNTPAPPDAFMARTKTTFEHL